MKTGVVKGSFSPITKEEWYQILEWKKINHLSKVVIIPVGNSKISLSNRMKMIKQLANNYRCFSVALDYQLDIEGLTLELKSKPWDFEVLKLFGSTRKYLLANDIFVEEIARKCVSEKRWTHVLSMNELALELAIIYKVDLHKTKIAALFHDCTKNWNDETTYAWLRFINPGKLNQPLAILHQYTAVGYLKRVLKVQDKQVLKAVGNHVLGSDTSLLGKIIYVADKLDPSRDYDSSKEIELCKINLTDGFELVKRQQEQYVVKEGKLR